MNSTRWTIAALTFVSVFAMCLHAAAPKENPARQMWEYKTLAADSTERLTDKMKNQAGEEGWELVAVVRNSDMDVFYFKRPR